MFLILGYFYIVFGVVIGTVSLGLSLYNDIDYIITGDLSPAC